MILMGKNDCWNYFLEDCESDEAFSTRFQFEVVWFEGIGIRATPVASADAQAYTQSCSREREVAQHYPK